MSIRRMLAVSTVAALSLAGSAAVTAAPADAASLHGSCGKGWPSKTRDKVAITAVNKQHKRVAVAYVYSYVKTYPHSIHRTACAILRPVAGYTGSKHEMLVGIQFHKPGSPAPAKERADKYYVGPVTIAINSKYGTYRVFGAITIGKRVYNISGPWRS
ncbi:hypothetical protein NE236_29145 [Actinoallomurus purpureus]|uniref:hypothetical protein n=1 Tax=Actinoallomurus purpureus TaxID=478114 RepID=UPI0020921C08|nr:hypothetical protein [Actinoallomurus purpureus]MCO6009047.1 hypothetical protein [Actinoallomurus purpureus]